MAKQNPNNFEFLLYLYNQFVSKHRSIGKEARVYWHILDMYIKLGLSKKNRTTEKQYAQKLAGIIREAVGDWNTHLLILKGEEGKRNIRKIWKAISTAFSRWGMMSRASWNQSLKN